jgi:hypothetical protein
MNHPPAAARDVTASVPEAATPAAPAISRNHGGTQAAAQAPATADLTNSGASTRGGGSGAAMPLAATGGCRRAITPPSAS